MSDPKASASAVAQSKPSPVSNILRLAPSSRSTVRCSAKPSGAVVIARPISSIVSGVMAVRPRWYLPASRLSRCAHFPSSQSALLGR